MTQGGALDGTRTRRSIGMVAALVLAVGALGIGIAQGQTTGDTYTGCLRVSGKLVKVAVGDAPLRPCIGPAVEISWNETGPQGIRGPQGLQGPQGHRGEQGPPGVTECVGPYLLTGELDLLNATPYQVQLGTIRCDGFVNDLSVTSLGNDDEFEFVLLVNGFGTEIVCGPQVFPIRVSCSSVATAVPVSAGDTISLYVQNLSGTDTTSLATWSLVFSANPGDSVFTYAG